MNLHYLQHVTFEGLGSILPWAKKKGHSVSCTRLFADESLPDLEAIDALVVMGGPMGVHDQDRYPWLRDEKRFLGAAIESEIPILGICLGAQILADVLGARVYPGTHKEIGWFPIERIDQMKPNKFSAVFPDQTTVFHWHGDTFELPSGATHLARSVACENQAFSIDDRILALQFHLEMTAEAVAPLIENCSDELVEAPYIQDATQMLAQPQQFQQINDLMADCLDRLFQENT